MGTVVPAAGSIQLLKGKANKVVHTGLRRKQATSEGLGQIHQTAKAPGAIGALWANNQLPLHLAGGKARSDDFDAGFVSCGCILLLLLYPLEDVDEWLGCEALHTRRVADCIDGGQWNFERKEVAERRPVPHWGRNKTGTISKP